MSDKQSKAAKSGTRISSHDDGTDAVARAKSVVELLRSATPRIDTERALPSDVLAALHKARLFRLLLPRSVGGDEVHIKTLAQVMEIIAGANASTGWCIGQAAGCAMAAAWLQPAVAQRLFGPADAVLAWGAGIQGRAVAADGGYRISGKWTFASGCANATMLGAHCYVYEKDGTTKRMRADGRQVDRTALIVKGKMHVHDNWHTLGLRGTASNTYETENLFVPDEETIDREAPEEQTEHGTLYTITYTHYYAAAFSALMLGIAQSTVNELMDLALVKTPRGAASSMKESPVFQSQLAVLEARLRSLRAYLHTTLDDAWRNAEATGTFPIGERANIKLASTYLINQGVEIVSEAYRAAGATAIFPTNPFEQKLRDAMTASQQTQGRPLNYITLGRVLLGMPPDTILLR